jgi:acetyl-CoA decarbonylase/synthase complex subunit delta
MDLGEIEPRSSDLVKKLLKIANDLGELEIENVSLEAEELSFVIQPIVSSIMQSASGQRQLAPESLVHSLNKASFSPPLEQFSGQVVEVQLGAGKTEGGSRKKIVKIGGEKTMPFYSFEKENPNRPAFAIDIFDMPLKLAKMVKIKYEDVMEDPAEWAKKAVGYGADVVSLNLISTDPLLNDTPAKDAAKVVENVLQAVDVPLIIGGSGNMEKDPLVLEAAAEAAAGERVVLNSAKTDNDYKKIVKVAKNNGHSVIAFTPMDINNQKKLNRLLIDEGLQKDRILIDPTTAALGYGIDYSLSLMERIKMAGLLGDEDLQMPILAPASNAWGAREAWMKNEELGPRKFRGPLWETITTLTILLSGGNLFMLSHPASVRIIKKLVEDLRGKSAKTEKVKDWITSLG